MNSVIQKFVKNYKSGFKPYSLNIFKAYEIGTFFVEFENGNISKQFESSHREFLDKFLNKTIENLQHPIINLASSSKPILIKILIEAIANSGKFKSIEDVQFKVSKSFIDEMLMRKERKRILSKKYYSEIHEIVRNNSDEKSNFVNYPEENFPEINVPFEEIAYAALKLSSNRAIEIAISELNNLLGNGLEIQKFLDKLKIAHGYEIHRGGNLYWEQPGANTGGFTEFVKAFDNLTLEMKNSLGKSDFKSKMLQDMYSAMSNNEKYFDVSYSHKIYQIGKLSSERNILEKTGIMWPIAWGEKLSEEGFPPHLSMGTIVTIFENGVRRTFAHFKCIAIAIPKSFDDEEFFNLDEKNYKTYLNVVKHNFLVDYTSEQITIINRLISNTKINIFQRFKIISKIRLRKFLYILKFILSSK